MAQNQLQRQNIMLKEYVKALQGQNNSRNIEKDLLLKEIDRLSAQIQSLRNQGVNMKNNSENSKQIQFLNRQKRQLEERLRTSQINYTNILKQKTEVKNENARLKVQVQNLNNRQRNVQPVNSSTNNNIQLIKLKNENQQLKRKATILQKRQNQIKVLQSQNQQLRNKTNQFQNKEVLQAKQFDKKFNQFKTLQNQKIKQLVRSQFETQKQKQINEIKNNFNTILQRKDQTIRQLQANLNKSQVTYYNNDKNSSVQLTQLRITKGQLQRKISLIQQQKSGMESKINQLKLQLSQKNNLLNSSRADIASVQGLRNQLSRKQEQINRSNIAMQALKQNVSVLEQRVKQHQKSIQYSKTQENNKYKLIEESKRQQIQKADKKYDAQINQLKSKLQSQQNNFTQIINEQKKYSSEKQRQNLQLKKILHQLSQNNRSLIDKISNGDMLQSNLQNQKNNQVAFNELNLSIRKSVSKHENQNQGDLRAVIQQLRQQLREVKSDFKRIQVDNKKMGSLLSSKAVQISNIKNQNYNMVNSVSSVYPSGALDNSLNIQKRLSHIVKSQPQPFSPKQSTMSVKQPVSPKFSYQNPTFAVPEPLIQVQKVKHSMIKQPQHISVDLMKGKPMQRDKWQMLQKRINQLRQQNDELKHSLYS